MSGAAGALARVPASAARFAPPGVPPGVPAGTPGPPWPPGGNLRLQPERQGTASGAVSRSAEYRVGRC